MVRNLMIAAQERTLFQNPVYAAYASFWENITYYISNGNIFDNQGLTDIQKQRYIKSLINAVYSIQFTRNDVESLLNVFFDRYRNLTVEALRRAIQNDAFPDHLVNIIRRVASRYNERL